MKKCNEVMTKNPVCCRPDDMVTKAAQLMQSENIGSIPVIENERTQKLVGIVTDRDLVLKIIAKGHDVKSTKVEAAMTRQVTTCRKKPPQWLRNIAIQGEARKSFMITCTKEVAPIRTPSS